MAGIPENADFPVIQARLDSMAGPGDGGGLPGAGHLPDAVPRHGAERRQSQRLSPGGRGGGAAGLGAGGDRGPAATDGAYLSTYGVPTVDALSAIAEQIHTTEERVRIPSIRDRTALCAAMLGLLG